MSKHQEGQHSNTALPLETYFREINSTPLLDAEQERELAWRIGEGDAQARDHLVRANLRLVVKIAKGYTGRGLPLEDLIAEGNGGLLRAVDRYDVSRGVRFCTFAVWWIKKAIRLALIDTGTTIRLPGFMVERISRWKRASITLQQHLGRVPTQEEIAVRLGLSDQKRLAVQQALRIQYGALQEGGRGVPALAHVAWNGVAPDSRLAEADQLRRVQELLDEMEPREAAVLRLRFGIRGDGPRMLKGVGQQLQLTGERVRQIERDALAKLREHVEVG